MNSAASPKRGEIFMVDWSPGRGSEQAGERPAVIVQTDAFNSNDNYPNTVVVTVSKSGRDIPTHVKVPQCAENGLWEPLSYIKCEQIMTIDRKRLGRRMGRITDDQLMQIAVAIKRVLSLR
jgi:mRNA interferase MazF